MLAEPNPRVCRRLLHLCVRVCTYNNVLVQFLYSMFMFVCVSCCTVMFMRAGVCVCVCVCVVCDMCVCVCGVCPM